MWIQSSTSSVKRRGTCARALQHTLQHLQHTLQHTATPNATLKCEHFWSVLQWRWMCAHDTSRVWLRNQDTFLEDARCHTFGVVQASDAWCLHDARQQIDRNCDVYSFRFCVCCQTATHMMCVAVHYVAADWWLLGWVVLHMGWAVLHILRRCHTATHVTLSSQNATPPKSTKSRN